MGKYSYYAVANGRSSGVYNSWSDCNANVSGYSGAAFKGFNSQAEATAYASGGSSSSSSSSRGTSSGSSGGGYSGGYSGGSSSYTSSASYDDEPSYSYAPPVRTTQRAPVAAPAKSAPRQAASSSRAKASVDIYTDGSALRNSSSNPGPAGAGVYITGRDSRGAALEMSYKHSIPSGTSTSAELEAVSRAATALGDVSRELSRRGDSMSGVTVNLHSDSDWAVKSVGGRYRNTGEYAAKVPRVQQQLRDAEAEHGCTVQMQWVKAHAGNPGNERADALALEASRSAVCSAVSSKSSSNRAASSKRKR